METAGPQRPKPRTKQAAAASKALVTLALLALPAFLGPLMHAFGRVIPLSFFSSGDRYMFRVLDQAGIYVLLALGLNIVVGYAGLLDLGYVAFYAVGAYTYALLASPQLALHIPFWLVLPLAPFITALFGGLPPCGCEEITWRSSPLDSGRSSGSSSTTSTRSPTGRAA